MHLNLENAFESLQKSCQNADSDSIGLSEASVLHF